MAHQVASDMTAASEIWAKADLRLHYNEILEAGLTAGQLAHFRRHGRFDGVARTDAVVLNGDEYRMVASPLRRLKDSNKVAAAHRMMNRMGSANGIIATP